MPPSAKDSEFTSQQVDDQGFPSVNGSRRRQPPPKLKKPVPHYRHLVRWSKDKVPESVEEQQMNQDLEILRHILDLFLNSRMAEAEAILAKGAVPVGEGLPIPGATASTGAGAEKAAEANQASTNKDDDASSFTSSSAPSTTPSSANNNNSKDEKSEKKSASQSSSTASSNKKSGSKEVRSMYFELAKGIIQGLRALVTFDPFEIEDGMKAFEQAIKTADKQRKGTMLGFGSVKAVGSFVVGTIGAGSFKGMNRVQKHAVSLVLL